MFQRGFGLDFLDHFRTVGLIAGVNEDPLFAPHRGIAAAAVISRGPIEPDDPARRRPDCVLSVHFRKPRRMTAMVPKRLEQQARAAAEAFERLVGH